MFYNQSDESNVKIVCGKEVEIIPFDDSANMVDVIMAVSDKFLANNPQYNKGADDV